jgi:cytochrome c oxidase subunit 4
MSDDAHDIQKHVRGYLIIGAILLAGTVITVLAAQIDLGHHWINVGVGLLIATVKASLVALYFMHLISEKTAIYMFLSVTVFFFAGLCVLTLWASHDLPKDSEHTRLPKSGAVQTAAEHHH